MWNLNRLTHNNVVSIVLSLTNTNFIVQPLFSTLHLLHLSVCVISGIPRQTLALLYCLRVKHEGFLVQTPQLWKQPLEYTQLPTWCMNPLPSIGANKPSSGSSPSSHISRSRWRLPGRQNRNNWGQGHLQPRLHQQTRGVASPSFYAPCWTKAQPRFLKHPVVPSTSCPTDWTCRRVSSNQPGWDNNDLIGVRAASTLGLRRRPLRAGGRKAGVHFLYDTPSLFFCWRKWRKWSLPSLTALLSPPRPGMFRLGTSCSGSGW